MRFFHWELEFPDVFAIENAGFDALVGNPPWEIAKANSKEFFSNYDPIYRTYGKQDALSHQTSLFRADSDIERSWLSYTSRFKGMSNWVNCAVAPFGDPKDVDGTDVLLVRGKGNVTLHNTWRSGRSRMKGYADAEHPYQYQGSADINTYKMFLELSYAVLKRNGRLGMLAPAGVYGDKGSSALRGLFLEKSGWEYLYGFDNKDGIFSSVHRDTKFPAIIVTKGAHTSAVKAAFLRRSTQDWESAQPSTIPYPVVQVSLLSPIHRAFWEVLRQRDLDLITRIYANSVILGDPSPGGWQLEYTREFDMTNHSKLFPVRLKWEDKGYRPNANGRWIDAKDDVAVPLFQGVMIGQFDISRVHHEAAGNQDRWIEASIGKERPIIPKFLMSAQTYQNWDKARRGLKLAFRDVSNPTNKRTMIGSLIPDFPCGNVLGILTFEGSDHSEQIQFLRLVSILNSFTFDFCARVRMNGKHLNWFVVEELPILPKDERRAERTIALSAARLNHTTLIFAPQWLELASNAILNEPLQQINWYALWAAATHERLRVRSVLDAIIAELYGLSFDDFAWILRNDPSDPKGFWRVDQEKPLELRQTTLALAAFRDLKELGLDAFCVIRDPEGLPGCGWQVPETLSFAVRENGIIEFDAPDGDTYAVREGLGPRFLPWQLEGTPEESWAECELHARNILGEAKFKRLMAQLRGEDTELSEAEATAPVVSADGHAKLFATGHPNRFGEDTPTKMKRRKN